MKHQDKAELLKNTITALYSKEGRSLNYISKLLCLDRKVVTAKISEWGLKEAPPKRRLTPANEKFLRANRQLIKSRLDSNATVSIIAKELGCTPDYLLRTIIPQDDVLAKSLNDNYIRRHTTHEQRVSECMQRSSRLYIMDTISDESWLPILGYTAYEVSNKGRIRSFSKKYNAYYALRMEANKNNGRLYVRLTSDTGEHRNLQVARLVAHAFVTGYDSERNTVNHIDGNVSNNCADNLEWVTQSANNAHAYATLKHPKIRGKRYKFTKIMYKGTYEFKSVAALARFIGKTETQVRRYLGDPEKHDLKLIIE